MGVCERQRVLLADDAESIPKSDLVTLYEGIVFLNMCGRCPLFECRFNYKNIKLKWKDTGLFIDIQKEFEREEGICLAVQPDVKI